MSKSRRGRRERAASQADVVLNWLLADLPVTSVAKMLGVSASTIRSWNRNGVPKKREDNVNKRFAAKSARDQIDTAMTDAQHCAGENLGGFPDVRTHENKDGSIDSQLTVYTIPRGMSVIHALSQFSECSRALFNTFNTYVQVGLRWAGIAGHVPDSGDRRYRGLAEGSTFYYSIDRFGSAFRFALDMAHNVEAKSRNRKVLSMFVRLHWNPGGLPPKDWASKPIYRAYKRKGQS